MYSCDKFRIFHFISSNHKKYNRFYYPLISETKANAKKGDTGATLFLI